jgi:hypothetical protein
VSPGHPGAATIQLLQCLLIPAATELRFGTARRRGPTGPELLPPPGEFLCCCQAPRRAGRETSPPYFRAPQDLHPDGSAVVFPLNRPRAAASHAYLRGRAADLHLASLLTYAPVRVILLKAGARAGCSAEDFPYKRPRDRGLLLRIGKVIQRWVWAG